MIDVIDFDNTQIIGIAADSTNMTPLGYLLILEIFSSLYSLIIKTCAN